MYIGWRDKGFCNNAAPTKYTNAISITHHLWLNPDCVACNKLKTSHTKTSIHPLITCKGFNIENKNLVSSNFRYRILWQDNHWDVHAFVTLYNITQEL